MRYLGMSLGMAVALGCCAAFGTLIPPIFHGQFATKVLGTHLAIVILVGVAVCLVGIVLAGAAGISKEREMSEEQKRAAIKEFNLRKGLLVATFSGVMSACFAYGLDAGDPIKALNRHARHSNALAGAAGLMVVLSADSRPILSGALHPQFSESDWLSIFQFADPQRNPDARHEPILENATDAPAEEIALRRLMHTAPTAARSHAVQLLLLRAGRDHLVLPVLLLHHGRNADGTLQVLELDAAHGQHHHLQYAVGYRAQGVEWHRTTHEVAGGLQPSCSGGLDYDCRLRQLSGNHADYDARIIPAMKSCKLLLLGIACFYYRIAHTNRSA